MFNAIFKAIFGTKSQRDVKKMLTLVRRINDIEIQYQQLTDEQLVAAGVGADLIRFSCGLENAEDLIADLKQALEKV